MQQAQAPRIHEPVAAHLAHELESYKPKRVMPHVHVAGWDSSVEGQCDHLALSHGFRWPTVGVAAARGLLRSLHVEDHQKAASS